MRHPLISQLLDNADDADAISYLVNVNVEELDKPGFRITFVLSLFFFFFLLFSLPCPDKIDHNTFHSYELVLMC
jgi:hypothetical protein